jgi:hypothetical protein
MALSIIELQARLELVLEENSYTLGELQSHPLAAPYTPKFDAFQATWTGVNAQRIELVIALGKADGAVAGIDENIDDLVDVLDRTLLIATKNDRTAPLYQLYFGAKPPSLLKRPILGQELETVRAWIPSIEGSSVPAVAALAPAFKAAITAADAAVAARTKAAQALKDFDTVGPKKALIDGYNALRKTVYGELGAMPHQNPAAMLPPDFADRFFRHNAHKGGNGPTNAKDAQAAVDALEKQLEAAKAVLATVTAKEKAKADGKAAAEVAAAAAAQAKKDAAAAKQKAAELDKQARAQKSKAR